MEGGGGGDGAGMFMGPVQVLSTPLYATVFSILRLKPQ